MSSAPDSLQRPRDLIGLGLNQAEPTIMHIDLNSCFAIIEQQANRLARGRPVGVAAYDTPKGIILASSYEAKQLGIKLGTRVGEARTICPGIYITTPDPEKYREAHRRFRSILRNYTDDVHAKSIDEFAIDFTHSLDHLKRGLESIGYEIKQRIRDEVGEAVTCNVGIGTNRFWAKTAAGLHKPDGLDTIDAHNVRTIMSRLELMDLCGINRRYRARLELAGVINPLQLLDADSVFLEKQVFKSIVGYYWYLRMRGWEIDSMHTTRRSFGHQYALAHKTIDKKELDQLLMKLCEKAGRRLRRAGVSGRSINLSLRTETGHLHTTRRLAYPLYAGVEIYAAASRLLNGFELEAKVTVLSMSVGSLEPVEPEQLNMLETYKSLSDSRRLASALDAINNRFGEFTVVPATMIDMDDKILDRIAFGNVSEI